MKKRTLRKMPTPMEQTVYPQVQILLQMQNILEQLFKIRLIQKLSRPIQNSVKLSIAGNYKQKLKQFEQRSNTFLLHLQKYGEQSEVNKSEVEYRNNKLRAKIREIEVRFIEILKEGSFKRYDKIAQIIDLDIFIDAMAIEDWAAKCWDILFRKNSGCC